MEQDKRNIPDSNDNRGSAPFPEEAFNRGDGNYDEQKASDKEYLRGKMDGNMPVPEKQNIDELERDAEQGLTRKPRSQSNSSGRHNNGREGGK